MNENLQGGGADSGHADIEHLVAYAHGEIRGAEGDALLRHGLACRECGDQLAVMLALVGSSAMTADAQEMDDDNGVAPAAAVANDPDDADDAEEPKDPEDPEVTPLSWLPAIAAAIVVTLTLGTTLVQWWPDDADGPPLQGVAPQGGPAIAGSGGTESAPASPRTAVATAPLDPATVARMRALATAAPPHPVTLGFLFDAAVASRQQPREGFALLIDRRYPEAIAQLTPLVAASPDDGEAAAALGIAMYLWLDDGERVEALLQQGRALPRQDFSRLSGWYLANLYLRRGDVVQAREMLESLASQTDGPGTEARNLLERMRTEGQ